jgi:RNA 2',3'-cyclic 3'-phosphodiesterase
MHRLFVAIRPPLPVRTQLLGLMGGVEGARWQDDTQLHLTLRFIGEVDGRTAEDIAAALGNVRFPAFDVALWGVGTFDRKGRIDTLWAGAVPVDPLVTLHRKVDRVVAGCGLEPERRAYVPHITLARFTRAGAGLGEFMAAQSALASPPFRVSQFSLYESRIGKEGAFYEAVADYPLV